VQHSGKIFLGQADVPLSERGKGEAAAASDELLRLGARPKRIYASDLARAKATADIIAKRLGGIPVMPDILLREMAMGSWDGELIEEIKRKFPGEYEKRGDDLRNYRAPGGENFYDLRGRVVREFHRIVAEDFRGASGDGEMGTDAGDLVIVAHLGVITVLAEEILSGDSGNPGGDIPQTFATGSVTAWDAPEWLTL
jgi:probable phosphoglycerate mutase